MRKAGKRMAPLPDMENEMSELLDPDMPAAVMRLHMGEMTAQEMRTARAAIRWANSRIGRTPDAGGNEVPCSANPDAPHGFNRNASHTLGRYVCDCEGWAPPSTIDCTH